MGSLIAIEGLDGSGKETQSALLCSSLEKGGRSVVKISFPDYESRGSEPVKMYLEGKLGSSPGDTGAYAASVLFASDRYISYKTKWQADYENKDSVIVANRYVTANAYHQMAKLPEEKWDDFLKWLWDLEFCRLGLPRPKGVIMLSLPTEVSAALIDKRCRETGAVKDIHECDADYLQACRKAALYSAKALSWTVVECSDGRGGIKPAEEIHSLVCSAAADILGFDIPV